MTSLLISILLNPLILVVSFGLVAITILLQIVFRDNAWRSKSTFADMFVRALDEYKFNTPDCNRQEEPIDYFDINKLLMGNPTLADKASSLFADALQRYPDAKVCFLEKNPGSGGVLTIAGAIAIKLNKPISKFNLERDVIPRALGGVPIGHDDKVVMVQDVLRTGSLTKHAVDKLEKFKVGSIIAVISLIDCGFYGKERVDEFRDMGIELVSILTLSDIEERKKQLVHEKHRKRKKLQLPVVG